MPGRTMTLRTQTPGGQTKPLYTLAELEDAIYAAYMVAPVVCREIGLGGIGERIALTTLRAQVETLRAALAGVLPGIDEAWALWPEGRNAVLKARAALAATEPKG